MRTRESEGVQLVRTGRDQRRVVKKQLTATWGLADFLNRSYTPGSREKSLQRKVLRELEPLLPRDEEVKTATIEFHLGCLQKEINRLNIRPYWVITPAQIALKGLRPGESVCEILGTRWVVSKRPFSSTAEGSVYLNIISSLESGAFPRLRRCGECGIFFVALHGGMAYCKPECQRMHDRKAALDRVRKWREDKTLERLNDLRQADEERGYKSFRHFLQLAKKTSRTSEGTAEILPILKRLGRGESMKGWTIVKQWRGETAEVWENLTKEHRNLFK